MLLVLDDSDDDDDYGDIENATIKTDDIKTKHVIHHRNKPASHEHILEDGVTNTAGDGYGKNAAAKVEPPKSSAKSQSLLGGTARFMKRALPGSVSADGGGNYSQFVDADSDDIDKPPPPRDVNHRHHAPPQQQLLPTHTKSASSVVTRRPRADSSSDATDILSSRDQQQNVRAFNYEELDDEYGSRKVALKRSPSNYGAESGDDTTQKSYDDNSSHGQVAKPVAVKVKATAPAPPSLKELESLSGPDIQPPDRIVGHEYGVRPLLDDDELSDSEFGRADTNPFRSAAQKLLKQGDKSTLATGGGGSPFAVTLPALSSPAQQQQPDAQFDVFFNAPFRLDDFRAKTVSRSGSSTASPRPVNVAAAVAADPFTNAPLNRSVTSSKSPPSSEGAFVNKVAFMNEQDCLVYTNPLQIDAPTAQQYAVAGRPPINLLQSHVSAETAQRGATRATAPPVVNLLSSPTLHSPCRSHEESASRRLDAAVPVSDKPVLGSGSVQLISNVSPPPSSNVFTNIYASDARAPYQSTSTPLRQSAATQYMNHTGGGTGLDSSARPRSIAVNALATQSADAFTTAPAAPRQSLFGASNFSCMSVREAEARLQSASPPTRAGTRHGSGGAGVSLSAGASPHPISPMTSSALSTPSPSASSPQPGAGAASHVTRNTVEALWSQVDKSRSQMSASFTAGYTSLASGKHSPIPGGEHSENSDSDGNVCDATKLSPRAHRRDQAKSKYKGDHEDENAEVLVSGETNYGSLKRQHKLQQKRKAAAAKAVDPKQFAEFANLGFCDFDPEKEAEFASVNVTDNGGGASCLNMSMDGALRSGSRSGGGSFRVERGKSGYNTLPRTGGSKHKKSSKVKDGEALI